MKRNKIERKRFLLCIFLCTLQLHAQNEDTDKDYTNCTLLVQISVALPREKYGISEEEQTQEVSQYKRHNRHEMWIRIHSRVEPGRLDKALSRKLDDRKLVLLLLVVSVSPSIAATSACLIGQNEDSVITQKLADDRQISSRLTNSRLKTHFQFANANNFQGKFYSDSVATYCKASIIFAWLTMSNMHELKLKSTKPCHCGGRFSLNASEHSRVQRMQMNQAAVEAILRFSGHKSVKLRLPEVEEVAEKVVLI